MRTSLFSGLLITAMLCNINCQKSSTDKSNADYKQDISSNECISSPKYSIARDSVLKDINHYIGVMGKLDTLLGNSLTPMPLNFPVRAFTIRSTDLLEALGLPFDEKKVKPKYENVRIYIGMDKNSQFKLFFTPVVGADLSANPPIAGKDHYLCKQIKDENGNVIATQEYLLDFSKPCPNTCPDSILLN